MWVPADILAVGVGAVLGAVSRYQVGRMATEFIATDPVRLQKLAGWHTAGINIGGSFLLGGITAVPVAKPTTLAQPNPTTTAQHLTKTSSPLSKLLQGPTLTPRAKLLMGVGFCGSFTTFSTFSVDIVTMLEQGKTARALSYIAANNVGGVAAAAAGMLLVRRLL